VSGDLVERFLRRTNPKTALDHDDLGPNRSKVMNVIDSRSLERDAGGMPRGSSARIPRVHREIDYIHEIENSSATLTIHKCATLPLQLVASVMRCTYFETTWYDRAGDAHNSRIKMILLGKCAREVVRPMTPKDLDAPGVEDSPDPPPSSPKLGTTRRSTISPAPGRFIRATPPQGFSPRAGPR
jgi:hypothetical protein